jgi:ABC-2 type transport system ATP-binding protein
VTIIATSSLTKRYTPTVTALADLTVEVEPGIIGWSVPTAPGSRP